MEMVVLDRDAAENICWCNVRVEPVVEPSVEEIRDSAGNRRYREDICPGRVVADSDD